jgi:hypothetical protein
MPIPGEPAHKTSKLGLFYKRHEVTSRDTSLATIAAFRRQGFCHHGSLPLPPGTPPQWHGGTVEMLFRLDLA